MSTSQTIFYGVIASLIAAALYSALIRVLLRKPYPLLAGGRDAVHLTRPAPGKQPDMGTPFCSDPGDNSIKASLRWDAGGSEERPEIHPVMAVIRFDDGHDRGTWERGKPTRRIYVNDTKEYVFVFRGEWRPESIGPRGGIIAFSYRLAGRTRLRHSEIRFESGRRIWLSSQREAWAWRYVSERRISRLRYARLRWV